jgi:hypothetical protein
MSLPPWMMRRAFVAACRERFSPEASMSNVTIRIGNETRDLSSVSESWITEQVNRRQAAGQDVCVQVSIHTDAIQVALTTPGCGGGGGGGIRRPNPNEQDVFELWNKRGLNASGFTGGNVVAFVKQLKKLLG